MREKSKATLPLKTLLSQISSGIKTNQKTTIAALTTTQISQRVQSSELYVQQNRHDLSTVELDEIIILRKYLPERIEFEVLKECADKILVAIGQERLAGGMKLSVKDFADAMKRTNILLKDFPDGSVDKKQVADYIKSQLTK